jgi:hypothetical protein
LVVLVLGALVLFAGHSADAWIENRVTGHEAHVEIEASGRALLEHRVTLRMNGDKRQKTYRIRSIDPDAVPLPNSYVIPARDALSSSLDSATPVSLKVEPADKAEGDGKVLAITVGDPKGLRRGLYVFVLRYHVDLRARGLMTREGNMIRVQWVGPRFDDGFDNARVTFVVPPSPTPPRAGDAPGKADEDGESDSLPPTFLSEVRRGNEHDEVELLRPYAPQNTAIPWTVLVDPRAFEPLPASAESAAPAIEPPPAPPVAGLPSRAWLWRIAALVFLLFGLLVWLKAREVERVARAHRATLPPVVPLPALVRAPLAAAALVGGLALQLVVHRAVLGSWLVIAACILSAHGAARIDPRHWLRGPGRWLTVSDHEALGKPPRMRGAWLDVSTRAGKLLLVLTLAALGAGVYFLSRHTRWGALLVAFDAVVVLSLFGTGRMAALPPDLAVEPARFLRRIVKRLRKMRGAEELKIVARLRVPQGSVDADELRLMIAPRLPLRGFAGLEVGISYALGVGTRVAMPELLLRVVAGSACEAAVSGAARRARVTPGRRPDEHVYTFVPRLPTVRMTSELAGAVAARVTDRDERTHTTPPPGRTRQVRPKAA